MRILRVALGVVDPILHDFNSSGGRLFGQTGCANCLESWFAGVDHAVRARPHERLRRSSPLSGRLKSTRSGVIASRSRIAGEVWHGPFATPSSQNKTALSKWRSGFAAPCAMYDARSVLLIRARGNSAFHPAAAADTARPRHRLDVIPPLEPHRRPGGRLSHRSSTDTALSRIQPPAGKRRPLRSSSSGSNSRPAGPFELSEAPSAVHQSAASAAPRHFRVKTKAASTET